MSIAAAYWAMGIGQSFTKFEKVEFTSIYADPPDTTNPGNYTVYIVLKNTGSAAATIDNIFLNGRPWDKGYTGVTQHNLINQTLVVGASTTDAMILLPETSPSWGHGNSVEVVIHTAAGRSYSNTVVLP